MKQYTTPVIQWIFKYINLSTIEQIRVIIKDEANNMIEITDPEIHGNVVQVRLTQEQTVHGHGIFAGRERSGVTG